MTDTELQQWAESHAEGPMRSTVAVAVLRVLGERELAADLIDGLARRVFAQSEILSQRAERKVTNG